MLDGYYEKILQEVQVHPQEDSIHACDGVDVDSLLTDCDRLLNIANSRLHVFPFNNVQPCWFRLYTDASIIKAVKLVQGRHANIETPESVAWLDEVVSLCDMALIMAGGLGREDMIHDLIAQLQQDFVSKETKGWAKSMLLPQEEVLIPKLQHPIQSLIEPSMLSFQNHIQKVKAPTVITGIVNHWPALEKWKSVEYLSEATFDGRRLVPIEVGRSYVDDGWGQRIVPFKTFVEQHILQRGEMTGYLAQHDILTQVRPLRADIMIPDYCYLDPPSLEYDNNQNRVEATNAIKTSHPSVLPAMDTDSDVHMNFWFGPVWTISPLHHDPYHNILCQIVGKKYIRLYDPRYSSHLFPRSTQEPAPHGKGDSDGEDLVTIDMSNTSQIDIAAMEMSPHEDWEATYPGLSQVPYHDIVLEAGQALYIPVGWWHYVRSLSVGISVSFWWN